MEVLTRYFVEKTYSASIILTTNHWTVANNAETCTCPDHARRDDSLPNGYKHRQLCEMRVSASPNTEPPDECPNRSLWPTEASSRSLTPGESTEDTHADGCDYEHFEPRSLPYFERYLSGVREVPER